MLLLRNIKYEKCRMRWNRHPPLLPSLFLFCPSRSLILSTGHTHAFHQTVHFFFTLSLFWCTEETGSPLVPLSPSPVWRAWRGFISFWKKKKEKTDMFLQIDLPAVEQAPDTHIQTHLHLRKQATCVWESFFPPVIGCNWRYLLFIVSLKTTGNQKQKTASDVYFCVCVYEIIETCQFQQFTFLFFFKYQKSQTALHENCSWLVVHGLFLFWKVSMFWLRA